MIKLEIKEINGFEYKLVDEKNIEYKFNLEFQDVDSPKEEDYIIINEKLLDKNYEEYSNFYTFGPLKSEYGRKISNENKHDVISIKTKNDIILLQRYYG